MLPFQSISIQDKEYIESYTSNINSFFCDHSFVDIFMWKDSYQTKFCIKDDFLFFLTKPYPFKMPIYTMPIGNGNIQKAISLIQADASERNIPFYITCISLAQKKILENTYGKQFTFQELTDSADYIYRSDDLIHLRGNRFHKKKNLVNRFMKIYENRWRYEPITERNLSDVMQYTEEWYFNKNNELVEPLIKSEEHAVLNALKNFGELNILGGLLRLDNDIIAFSLGSKSKKDIMIIQVEKANPKIIGAYQMINQQFAIANCQDVLWINREEDLGIEGLRKSKLSYHPAFFGIKYLAKHISVVNENIYSIRNFN